MNPLGLLGKLAKNKDSNDKWKAIKKILIKTILKMVLGFAFSFGGVFLILVAAWYIIDGGRKWWNNSASSYYITSRC